MNLEMMSSGRNQLPHLHDDYGLWEKALGSPVKGDLSDLKNTLYVNGILRYSIYGEAVEN